MRVQRHLLRLARILRRAPPRSRDQARPPRRCHRRSDQASRRAPQGRRQPRADPLADLAKKRAAPVFADFVRERYLPHVQERLRSACNIEAYLRKRILFALGCKALDEIGQDDIVSLRRGLIDEGLSPSSFNRHLATVRSMFNLALRWQLFEG